MMRHSYILIMILGILALLLGVTSLHGRLVSLRSFNYGKEIIDLSNEYRRLYDEFSEEYGFEDYISIRIDDLDSLYSDLIFSIDNLESYYLGLDKELKTLDQQYESLVKEKKLIEEEKKKHFIIDKVMLLNQYDVGLPTGCESVSLKILLAYYGIDVSLEEITSKLRKSEIPHMEGGILYGGDPDLEFIGDPHQHDAYGVYAKPILTVGKEYLSNLRYVENKTLKDILNIVKDNHPVIVWNSTNMSIPYISDSWIDKRTGKRINWLKNEHALVIIGYTPASIIVSDPLTGSIRYLDRKLFQSRYDIMGRKAIY